MIEGLLRSVLRIERRLDRLEAHELGRFVALAAPLTNADWSGDDTKTAGSTNSVDTSAWGCPAGVKAVLIYGAGIFATGVDANYCATRRHGDANNCTFGVAPGNGRYADWGGVVICDAAGDFDVVVVGQDMTAAYLAIQGYWI